MLTLFPGLFEAPNVLVEVHSTPMDIMGPAAQSIVSQAGASHIHVRQDGVTEMVCNSADVDALRSAVASLGIPHIHVKQDCSPLRLSRNARNAVAAAYEYLQIGAVVVSPYLLTSLKCLDDHGGNAVVAGSVMATWAASLVAGSMVPTRTSSPRLVLIAATAPLGLTALVNQVLFCY
ncbi:hypothetical protein AaE_007064 [Aphanomyces astaci]|uniref:Uncharacterized protein n=1 Tax=Aphanomyces astaci TaxID=112090 RepID=A0A6A5ABM9_APHAT|nr:hypothetical protein AaE_007064 [Aphanomyces astaci]